MVMVVGALSYVDSYCCGSNYLRCVLRHIHSTEEITLTHTGRATRKITKNNKFKIGKLHRPALNG